MAEVERPEKEVLAKSQGLSQIVHRDVVADQQCTS